MKWLYNFKGLLKPPLVFLGNIAIPLMATFVIWDALDRLVQILAASLLTLLVLKNLGFNINIASRLNKTKAGRWISFILRNTNTVTKINEEYFEETSILIVDGSKQIIKHTKKGGIRLKKFRAEVLLWLLHNKKQLLAVISLLLFAVDYYFGISKQLGLSPDVVYTIASVIFIIALWVMGGEGFTDNTNNRIKANAKIAKSETESKVKLYKRELKRINTKIDDVLKYKIGEMLPPDKKIEYDKLIKDKDYYGKKIEEFLDSVSKEEVLL
ncbi:MAG: hypothetical protein PF487_08870 [Bacteroidales bacterium]|nr:hypothetical protein [Bacteroidales bacterium]